MMTPWTLALSSTLVGLAVLLAAIAISLDAEASAWPHRIALKSTSSDNPNSTVQYVESVVSSRDANRKADRPRHLVIFFHGIGARGTQMGGLGGSWKSTLPNTVFAYPDAPFPTRSGGRQWFAVDNDVMRPERIAAARRAFDDLVSEIVERQGFENDLKNVAFVAVSQGAIMALDGVASGRWKIGALVSFAGILPLPPTSSSRATPILLMHGGADRTIPPAAAAAASRQLNAAGFDVTYKLFPEVGHTISAEEAKEAADFLRGRFSR
ncbi:alpha/beta hydrolase [Ensifer adhaerens]|jgi:phospholipase/carboxylesterase|uniref:alpha/beta hydrolase n=1 Tax=Ensifer adhaerens TaxID=106592 RepID=UPI00202F85D4|nr:dienelactone hydrolase family protein [Ensifer adhaerens]